MALVDANVENRARRKLLMPSRTLYPRFSINASLKRLPQLQQLASSIDNRPDGIGAQDLHIRGNLAQVVKRAPHGILVNSISPGPTARPEDLSPADWEEIVASAPLKRQSSEDDIAEMVASLLKMETLTGEPLPAELTTPPELPAPSDF